MRRSIAGLKNILVFLLTVIFAFFLNGCVQPVKYTGVTLRCAFIGAGDYEHIYKNIPEFEKQTGIQVEIIYKSNHFELDKKMKMDFEAGTVDYDVISDHSSFFSQYIDYLEPLNAYFTAGDLSDFLPRLINAGKKNGELYLMPRHADISCLHYSTDLFNDPKVRLEFKARFFRELTVPNTWDDFKEVALFFNSPPAIWGTQFAGKEEALTGRFYEILVSNGGEFIDSMGNAAFNSPAGIKAATMLHDLYKAGAMPPDMTNYLWDDLAKNFQSGKIAITPEWYSYYSYFQDEKNSSVAGTFDIAPLPMGDAGIRSGWGGIHGFSITKVSKHKREAAELIRFLTSKDNSFIEGKIGYLPVRNSVWDRLINDASVSSDPFAKKRYVIAKEQLSEDFFTPPLIPEWIPASNILFPNLQKIITGEIDIKTGLDDSAEQVNKLLAEYS